MKQLIYQSLARSGASRWLAWLHRHRSIILTYHGFGRNETQTGIQNCHALHLDVNEFRRQLEYLKGCCHVVPLQTLVDHYRQRQPLPPRSVVITMDDGYRSNYTLAYPLLREFDLPATVFLGTEFVDDRRYQWTDRLEYAIDQAPLDALHAAIPQVAANGHGAGETELRRWFLGYTKDELKRVPQEGRAAVVDDLERTLGVSLATATSVPEIYQPLAWDDVREMTGSGLVSFGSHTASHFILSRCTTEVIQREIEQAKGIIEAHTGVECPLFCYPNGRPEDFDARTRAAVEAAGHTCALTTIVGSNDATSDVFELRRMGVMNGHAFDHFVTMLSGFFHWVENVRGVLR